MTNEEMARRIRTINDNFSIPELRSAHRKTVKQWLRRQPPLVRQNMYADSILDTVHRVALALAEPDVGKVLAEFTETVNPDHVWTLEGK